MNSYKVYPAISPETYTGLAVMLTNFMRVGGGTLPTLFIGTQKACSTVQEHLSAWLTCKIWGLPQALLIGPNTIVWNDYHD